MSGRDLSTIHPTTVDGIKRLAKQIKKANNGPHHEALDAAAKQAGFDNYRHALNKLGDGTANYSDGAGKRIYIRPPL